MTDTQQAVATQPQPKPMHPLAVLREQLLSRSAEFKNALPAHMPVERFSRVVLTAVQMLPELLACNRQTLFNACMKAANDGLLPDGRQGVILPFKDGNARSPTNGQYIAQWMPMVAGLLARFRNSGEYKSIGGMVVRQGDKFRHWFDNEGEHLEHEPLDDNDGAPITKAYVVAQLKSGGVMMKIMTRGEIERRRQSGKQPNSLMWTKFYEEGCLKTVIRNISKSLPSSSDDLDRLMARDNEIYARELPNDRPARIAPGVTAALEHFGSATPADDDSSQSLAAQGESAPQGDAPNESPAPDVVGETANVAAAGADSHAIALALARERGKKAKADGVQRRALPGEYREAAREAEAAAWTDAWDGKLV